MPTYAYACTACDHRFDAVQSFSDASLTDCPECSGRLRKLFSAVGIVFKGSGFYRTDSRAAAGGRDSKDSKDSKSKPVDGASSGSSSNGSGGSNGSTAASTSKEPAAASTAKSNPPSST